MNKSLYERITIGYFEGSHYYEIMIDGNVVHTAKTQEDADLFVARLLLGIEK